MKTVSIVVPDGQSVLSSIVGPFKILTKANKYNKSLGKEPVFNIQLVGSSKKVDLYDGLFSIQPNASYKDIEKTHLIIIPAIDNANLATSIQKNEQYIPWLIKQYKNGTAIGSICTGAFLLAATGLLDGRSCSTHWNEAVRFRKMFPAVNMVDDKLITDEAGLYTSGGAYSFLHFMLYLVEKYYDRETAIFCSKIFEIDIDRSSQSPFTIFSGLKDHQDEQIKLAQNYIENNVREKISIEQLASKFAIGRRHFDRRFIKATTTTPLDYLQKVKIECAKKMLETSRKTISEVMYEVGYTDVKAFREVFKKITGLSPIDYRSQYNKEAVRL
jgi:transcriptional regulator GlxA family with amidase domain